MQKILFICRSNVARSQMAKELYNQFRPCHAEAAGISVDVPGQKLIAKARSPYIFEVMDELGIDLRENARNTLLQDNLGNFTKIIAMLDDPKQLPTYLKDDPRIELWDIKDPKYMTLEETRQVRDELSKKIEVLIK